MGRERKRKVQVLKEKKKKKDLPEKNGKENGMKEKKKKSFRYRSIIKIDDNFSVKETKKN